MRSIANLHGKPNGASIGLVISSLMLLLGSPSSGSLEAVAYGQSVLTQHNDNQRTGAQLHETQLTPATVAQSFGLLYTLDVSSSRVFPVANSLSVSNVPMRTVSGTLFPNTIGSQPLYVSHVLINGTSREVLYVSTRQNWIFAYDVTGTAQPQKPLWQQELRDKRGFGAEELPGMEYRFDGDNRMICWQTRGPVGISSTPVIDEASNTMWVVYRTSSPLVRNIKTARDKFPRFVGPAKYDAKFYIRKLDIRTGAEIAEEEIKLPAPADAHWADRNLTRPGLLLLSGVIYMGFAGAVCDDGGGPNDGNHYHGWIVALDANKLNVIKAVPTTPRGYAGGIWQSGTGLAADHTGYIFALTGNHEGAGGPEFGDSFLRIRANTLDVTPFPAPNWQRLDNPSDSDIASGGPVVLPNGLALGGGKPGMLYLMNPANMATKGYQTFYNTWHPEYDPCEYDTYQGKGPNIHGAPVVWHPDGVRYALVYHMPEKEYAKAFRAFDDGRFEDRPFLTTYDSGIRSPRGMPGGALSLSASGGRNGILWVSVIRQEEGDGLNTNGDFHGRLMAFDALTLTKLWEAPEKNVPFAKYIPPTIGGGKVFRSAYGDHIYVYGLPPINRFGIQSQKNAPSPPNRMVTAPAGSPINRLSIQSQKNAPSPPNRVVTAPAGSGLSHFSLMLPTRAVTTTKWRGSRLDLFITSRQMSGGSVLHTNWEPERCQSGADRAWRGWYPVDSDIGNANWGDGGQLPTDYSFAASGAAPVTALWRDGQASHLDVFVTDSTGRVMSNFWEPVSNTPNPIYPAGWRAWFAVAPASISVSQRQPITAVWRNPNHLDLFTVDRNGRVMSIYFENGRWQPAWFAINPNSGVAGPGQQVAAEWRNANHLDLFITGKDGKVLSTYFENNRWQPAWFPIDPQRGVAAPGQSVTAVWRDPAHNHLDLFITGADGRILSTYFDQNKWQTWFALSAPGAATPGQQVTALWRPNSGHLDLFVTGKDGRIVSTYFDNNRWQTAWFPISPNTASAEPGQPVTALWSNANHLDLFITGKDGRVMSIFFANNQWAPGWFTI